MKILVTATIQYETEVHQCSENEARQSAKSAIVDAFIDGPEPDVEVIEVHIENLDSPDGIRKRNARIAGILISHTKTGVNALARVVFVARAARNQGVQRVMRYINSFFRWLTSPVNCKLNQHEWVRDIQNEGNLIRYGLKCLNCPEKSVGWDVQRSPRVTAIRRFR